MRSDSSGSSTARAKVSAPTIVATMASASSSDLRRHCIRLAIRFMIARTASVKLCRIASSSAGPMVRIRFPPAASQANSGVAITATVSRRVMLSNIYPVQRATDRPSVIVNGKLGRPSFSRRQQQRNVCVLWSTSHRTADCTHAFQPTPYLADDMIRWPGSVWVGNV